MTYYQDQIDKYILHKMNEMERKDFEQQMENNPDLSESVKLQQMLTLEIKQRGYIQEIIRKSDQRRKTIQKIRIAVLSAAAIFIGVFFVNQQFVNNRMDLLYAEMYTSPVKPTYRSGETNTDEDTFFNAIHLLQMNETKEAQKTLYTLYQLPESFAYYEDVRWYLALTELKLHHKARTEKYLNELLNSEDYSEKVNEILKRL